MTIKIKTGIERIERNVFCVVPTLLIYNDARGCALGIAWLKWCGLLAIIAPNTKNR